MAVRGYYLSPMTFPKLAPHDPEVLKVAKVFKGIHEKAENFMKQGCTETLGPA